MMNPFDGFDPASGGTRSTPGVSGPAEMSDLTRRVMRLERRRPKAQPQPSPAPGFNLEYLDSRVLVADATITASTDWIDVRASERLPAKARYAVVWAGIKDTSGGTGQSLIEARGAGGKVIPIAEIFEPSSTATQNSFGYSWVRLSVGNFQYRVTMPGDATDLLYKIEIVGYVE